MAAGNSIPRNENERIIARIDAVFDRVSDNVSTGDDKRVLAYIRSALSPERIVERHEDDADVRHLHEIAKSKLRRYEKQEDTNE